jgi:hypothetical protein
MRQHSQRRPSFRKQRSSRQTRLALELLEQRQVLDAAPVTFAVIGDYGVASSILNLPNNLLGVPEGEGDVARLVHSWNPSFLTTLGDNNYLAGEQFDTNIMLDLQAAIALGTSPSTIQTILDDLDKLPVPGLAVNTTGATTLGSFQVTGVTLNHSDVAVGTVVYDTNSSSDNIPFPTGPSSPFFTTITGISGTDGNLTLTLSASARQTLSSAGITVFPANVSLQALDGLSHIDRNIGRYYSDFIYPYVPSSSTGQFGNGSPTGSNRMFPVPGNHDWADPFSDGGASTGDKELALPSQAVEKIGTLIGSTAQTNPTITVRDKSSLTVGMSVLGTNLPTIDPNNGKLLLELSIFSLARIQSIATNAPSVSFNGDTTLGNANVTHVSSFAGLQVGMEVSGPGIPAGATITNLNPDDPANLVITLSANATATATQAALAAADFTITLTVVSGGVNNGVPNATFIFAPIFTTPTGTTIAGGTLDPYLNYFAGLNPGNSPGFKIGTTVSNGNTVPLTSPYYYSYTVGTTSTGQPLVEFFAFDSDPADPNLVNTAADKTNPTAAEVATSNEGVWLKNALASSTAVWKIPYFHHSPYTSSFEPDEGPNGEWMRLPFQQWGASAVMYGHVHNYERLSEKDPAIPGVSPAGTVAIPYILNGSGGASISPFLGQIDPGSQLRYNGAFGAMKVVVDEHKLNFQFVNVYGATIDDLTITPLVPIKPAASTPGVWDPATATWYLRNSNNAGAPDAGQFAYGFSTAKAVTGDWNGDGITTIGVFDPATATWYLRNSNSPGAPDIQPFSFGAPGWIPVVGDWNGDGVTTIGVVDPSTSTWYLRNSNSAGAPDFAPFSYGARGWIPVVGDWNGDGTTTIGVFNPDTATWYLRNQNNAGVPDFAPFAYGGAGWSPVVGDWDQNGADTVGGFNPANATWWLRNQNSAGVPDIVPFGYGMGAWTPVTGSWSSVAGLKAAQEGRGVSQPALTAADLTPILAEALRRLGDAGFDTLALANARIQIADLPGKYLGEAIAATNTIYLDRDAAGNGWFVDPTPTKDEEFVAAGDSLLAVDPKARGRVDLLTTVMHELGHLAGLDDINGGGQDLMNGILAAGIRRRV